MSCVHPFMTSGGRAASDLICGLMTSSACRQVFSMLLPQTRLSVVLTFPLPPFALQKAREASLKCLFHVVQGKGGAKHRWPASWSREKTAQVVAEWFALVVQGAWLARALLGWGTAVCWGRLGAHPVVATQEPQALCMGMHSS